MAVAAKYNIDEVQAGLLQGHILNQKAVAAQVRAYHPLCSEILSCKRIISSGECNATSDQHNKARCASIECRA